ncbi:MAG: hypothetical protein A2010_08695 [Nitrospirae bacterium GWD2_57_9]|nr:MAG: hypothetical protein A2010_08695 [Nitrospirae bacterium GWD2_57_9]
MNREWKQRSRTGTVLLVMLLFALAVQGCGSSSQETMPVGSGGLLSSSTPTAGVSACASCHTRVAADWLTTKHANLDAPGDDSSIGNPAVGQIAGCTANCHDRTGDSGNITAAGTLGNEPRPVVGCEACHGPGSLHVSAGGMGPIHLLSNGSTGTVLGSGPTATVSGMFVTCTSCHELLDSSGTLTVAAHDVGGADAVASEKTGTQYTITDTHSAVSNSWSSTSGSNNISSGPSITGYAMDYSRDRVCIDCHNPHKPADINREWAQSAHADRYGKNSSDPSGFFKGAWAYYNWSCDGTSAAGCGEPTPGIYNKRKACQRCHTTSGFSAYADALRSSDLETAEAISDGTRTSIPYDPGFKPEMLKCNGCHTDNKGTLRNPGAVTADYDLTTTYPTSTYPEATYAKASHAYPDVAGSNVCMACHTARESGDTIKNLNKPGVPQVNFANETLSFVNSHYLGAGGTVFRATGYTFTTRNYENKSDFRHYQIGTSAEPGTGTNGPCVGCHMSRENKNGNHLFLPVGRTGTSGLSTTGIISKPVVTITGITSKVCFNASCHGPNDAVIEVVHAQKEQLEEAMDAFKVQLEKRGYYYAEAHPYFYKIRDGSIISGGTVSVTYNSTIVTGTGVDWIASGVTGSSLGKPADRFRVNDDGAYYSIASVATGSISLQRPYKGVTNTSPAEYTILRGLKDPVTYVEHAIKTWVTGTTPDYPVQAVDTDTTGNTTGKNNMGAAFNFNLLDHDPGAYAHNRYYAKRLIYDSIDWLDDNQMNYSVGLTLNALPGGTTYKAGALEYLLNGGVATPYIAAERP